MAYRISYGPDPIRKRKGKRTLLFTGMIALLAVIWLAKEAGFSLLPGDPAVTANALEHMVSSVSEGEPVTDVFFAFCKEIIDGANLPY